MLAFGLEGKSKGSTFSVSYGNGIGFPKLSYSFTSVLAS